MNALLARLTSERFIVQFFGTSSKKMQPVVCNCNYRSKNNQINEEFELIQVLV